MIVMYDSISVDQIPHDPPAVAGYVGGYWPTYNSLHNKFPHAYRLSIAVNSGEDAECLDIEAGDATPGEAPNWVKRQHARGVHKPVVYASLSKMGEVLRTLEANGIPRHAVRVWSAHYTYRAHICSGQTCGIDADATQWTDRAKGRNLDESLCTDSFFVHPRPPRPKKHPRRAIHPKVKAAAGGGSLATALVAVAHALGLKITPAESGAAAAAVSVLFGYIRNAKPIR